MRGTFSTSSRLRGAAWLAVVASVLLGSCRSAEPDPARGAEPAPTTASASAGHGAGGADDDAHDIARAREAEREQAFAWQDWSPEVFERARAEGKFILLHCAAVWCHWCHVMEETTYLDPEIGRILSERFVAIRVDIDQRPDIEERYARWGWPATVLFTPEADQIGVFRGFIEADKMRGILESVEARAREAGGERAAPHADLEPGRLSARVASLPWLGARMTRDMDGYYDRERGSWGTVFKSPLGANAEFELQRAARGDRAAERRAVFSLRQFARLIDPVWGGIYQYSTHGDWDHAHFEKLMTYQADNVEAFARGYQVTGEADLLAGAVAITDYVEAFMTSPRGTFYVTQDADVGTHDKTQKFVSGHDYYRLDDAGRRALGIPWVDTHEYAYENGLMIAALVTLYEASGDDRLLARARRAADEMIRTHVLADGAVVHDADSASTVRYLADAAGLGRALARLAQLANAVPAKPARGAGEAGAVPGGVDDAAALRAYGAVAVRIADWMMGSLHDAEAGAFWAHTPDPAAAGVFAERRHAFAHNVLAARFLAALADVTGDAGRRARAAEVLAAISTPAALDDQGRILGAYLLALAEADAYAW